MRAHVIGIGPQANVRIVLEVAAGQLKVVYIPFARSVGPLRDSDTLTRGWVVTLNSSYSELAD
jgi:hypothetical protein